MAPSRHSAPTSAADSVHVGNCHDTSTDCPAGQVCGVTTAHTCGACGVDSHCTGDTRYGAGLKVGWRAETRQFGVVNFYILASTDWAQ